LKNASFGYPTRSMSSSDFSTVHGSPFARPMARINAPANEEQRPYCRFFLCSVDQDGTRVSRLLSRSRSDSASQRCELASRGCKLACRRSELACQRSELACQRSELACQRSELARRKSDLTRQGEAPYAPDKQRGDAAGVQRRLRGNG
jgi:hypothetical protein